MRGFQPNAHVHPPGSEPVLCARNWNHSFPRALEPRQERIGPVKQPSFRGSLFPTASANFILLATPPSAKRVLGQRQFSVIRGPIFFWYLPLSLTLAPVFYTRTKAIPSSRKVPSTTVRYPGTASKSIIATLQILTPYRVPFCCFRRNVSVPASGQTEQRAPCLLHQLRYGGADRRSSIGTPDYTRF